MFVSVRNLLGSFVCAVTLFTAVGCGCNPTRHPVGISMSPQFANPPEIRVVITALSNEEAAYLSQYPMSRFFAPGDTERGGLEKVVMEFGPNQPTTQTFSPADKDKWEKHWRVWEGRRATQLFVMAFLPGRFEDKPGNLDPRRQAVPLGSCKWEKDNSPIKFELTPAKLELLTPPRSGK